MSAAGGVRTPEQIRDEMREYEASRPWGNEGREVDGHVIYNAVITSVSLENEDRGLQAWLHLDYGGSGQGFGGWVLFAPWIDKPCPNIGGLFINRCLEIAGVAEWSKLPGRTIRVRKKEHFGSADAIGHIIKNDWFDPKAEIQALSAALSRAAGEEQS